MLEYLRQAAPFQIIPLAAFCIVTVLLVKNRAQIGLRRMKFGLSGLTLLFWSPFAAAFAQHLVMGGGEPTWDRVSRAATQMMVINHISSVLYGLALWLIFVAISNRRKTSNAGI